jgi:hypothetical protein
MGKRSGKPEAAGWSGRVAVSIGGGSMNRCQGSKKKIDFSKPILRAAHIQDESDPRDRGDGMKAALRSGIGP